MADSNESYHKHIAELLELFKINPTCAEVLNDLGVCYWKIGQLETAIMYFSDAVKVRPSYVKGWSDYAEALYTVKDLKRAKLAFQKLLKYEPKNLTRIKYGKVLQSIGQIAEAKEQYEIALKDAPNDIDLLYNLGNIYLLSDDFDTSVSYYRQVLKMDSNLVKVWTNLGIAYLKLQKYKNAISAFSEAIQLSPIHAMSLNYLAIALTHDGNTSLAVEIYEKSLKVNPYIEETYIRLAQLYIHDVIDLHAAESYLKKSIELNLQNEEVYKLLLTIYTSLKDFIKASDTCISLGDFYFKCNQYENAKYIYEYSLYFNSENPIGEYKVGQAMFYLEEFDSALSR